MIFLLPTHGTFIKRIHSRVPMMNLLRQLTDRTSPRFVVCGYFYLRVSHFVLTLSYLQPSLAEALPSCHLR